MTEYIILSRGEITTLSKNEPVTIRVDNRPILLCSDECFERQTKEESEGKK